TARPADSRLTAAKNRLPSARSEPVLCQMFPSGRGWPRRHTSTSSLSFQMRQLLLRRDAATRVLHFQKIPEQLPAAFCQHAFWVELHAFDGKALVAQPHDESLAATLPHPRANFQFWRTGVFFDDQRVVARSGERLGQSAEDSAVIVLHAAGLAMNRFRGAHYLAPKGGADRLMSE